MTGGLLRRAGIFIAVAGLGTLLATMLSGEPGSRETPQGPRLPVVPIPAGTDFGGTEGIPGVSLIGAEGVVVSDVRTVEFDDGTEVPFRAIVLRAAGERPLPSPAEGVQSLALDEPDLQIVPVPKDRAEWEASAAARPLRLRAPSGVLLRGPGDAMRLHLEGGVRVDLEREGVPWTVEGETADADLRTRHILAPGAVTVTSPEIEASGADLEAEEGGGRLLLSGGARGTVRRAGGARIGDLSGDGDLRFACSGPFLVERGEVLPAAPGGAAAEDARRFRITLREGASLEQGDGRLEGALIGIDLSRAVGRDGAPFGVTNLHASGGAVLTGGREGRTLEARARDLTASPRKDGTTAVRLEGEPVVLFREAREGGTRLLRASCLGPAAMDLPREEGPVTALFRGSAAAVLVEEGPGLPAPVRRDLAARMLRVEAFRPGDGGPTVVREVRAEGEAVLREEDRSARARVISWTPDPEEEGASRFTLQESVAVHWPAAGLLDPLSRTPPAAGAAPAEGSLLLATPGEALLLLPPAGADRGASVSVRGGTVLRRIVGEQEVYRLTCGRVEATLHPGNRGIAALEATKDVHLEGREENAGGRRYDLRGDRFLVAGPAGGTAGGEGPEEALLEGAGAPLRATARFTDEGGRPFSVTADSLRFDRATGAFRADGEVLATGILPEGGAGVAGAGGRAELACPSLSGVLEPGAAAGASRLRTLSATGPVWVKTETEFASGDRLRWDAAAGRILLEGSPARVSARSGAAALSLQDRCEAPSLWLTLAGGRLVEARAPDGGLLVRHRLPDAEPGKTAPPPERLEARCTGLLLYTPGETRMQGEVSLSRARRGEGGEFDERDRIEGADALRVLHPAAPGAGAGRLASAEALSGKGAMVLTSAEGSWKASGVSRAALDSATDTVLLDASMDRPRFRLEGGGRDGAFRRVVYDYRQGIFTEQVGATVGGGR